jgi:hypothetical protein
MFIRAKKAPRCPWQVFVASALMEWRHAREKDVARKIFEKGLEVAEFATVPEYVLAYAAFLCGEWLRHWCCWGTVVPHLYVCMLFDKASLRARHVQVETWFVFWLLQSESQIHSVQEVCE